jgi:hypothetical protein
MHAHNSLRSEITSMIKALESANKRGPLKAWEADCIKVFWEAHYSHILAHHHNEDVIFVPYLKTRFTYPEKVSASEGDWKQ